MADNLLTLMQVEDVFQSLTVSMIAGSPAADVRIAWPTDGAPSFAVTDDVAFLKLTEIESPITVQREEEFIQSGSPETDSMQMSYTRTWQVNWVFYGPASWDNSTTVRNKLFHQENHDTLALSNLYMVPDFTPATRFPELWQTMWYERVDLKILFNEKVDINREEHHLESAGIIVQDYSGIVATIDVET